MDGQQAYGAAVAYVEQTLKGEGALKGEKGDDGITPHIGYNGNWYIGTVDTGINAQGEDGFSPTIETEEIAGGHRVTVTDADGSQIFDVMDGKDGNDTVTPEAIQEAVDKYLNDNPVQSGATAEQAAQIEQNTADIEKIKKESENYITADDFPSYADVYGLLNESEVK